MTSSAPLLIGHRGASGHRPEHSRAAYALALAQGVDAVEPDVVATRDGVLVVRHENEISETTDVAAHPEFAARRTTKEVDGEERTGWFTEDFSWDELATLRTRERLPRLRPHSARHDGAEPILRLSDVLDLVAESPTQAGVVVEIKHASSFARLGIDLVGLVAEELSGRDGAAVPVVLESFEPTALVRARELGVAADLVALFEADGVAADLAARDGREAMGYREMATDEGLALLAEGVDGISVPKRLLLRADDGGRLVGAAHDRGLRVFTWTCRPENAFLDARFRMGESPEAWGDYAGEWRLLAQTGVDGVFVDHPDLAHRVFREDRG